MTWSNNNNDLVDQLKLLLIGALGNWKLSVNEKITITDEPSEKCKRYVQCRWIKTEVICFIFVNPQGINYFVRTHWAYIYWVSHYYLPFTSNRNAIIIIIIVTLFAFFNYANYLTTEFWFKKGEKTHEATELMGEATSLTTLYLRTSAAHEWLSQFSDYSGIKHCLDLTFLFNLSNGS